MIYSSNIYDQSQINYSTLSNKKHHKCLNCGLVFQSSYELLNHTKKFCMNSGFDTLAGLNVKLKNPNATAQKVPKRQLNDSLTNALEQIQKNKAFVPSQNQFINDLDKFQRDRQEARYARPYLHGSSKKKIQAKNSGRQSRSLYMSRNEQKNNQGYKQRNLSIHEPYQPYERAKSKDYSFTESHIKKFKQSKTYKSPPSQLPQLENAKQFSLLDRSDMSIRNMPEQEKREYVVRKILELEGIEQAYKKNGGRNEGFMENTQKMKRFYQDLLNDVNNKKQDRFGKISNGTRVSTPISKLQQLEQSNVSIESNRKNQLNNKQNQNQRPGRVKSRLGQIHQKSMAKRQEQIRRRFNTQFPQNTRQEQYKNNDILDKDILSKLKSQLSHNNKQQNPVIVIPIQQPAPMPPMNYQTTSNKQTQLMMKYIESINAIKEQQNSQYLGLLERQNQEMKKMYEESLKNKEKQFGQNQNKIKMLENNYNKLLDKFDKLKHNKQSQILYQQKLQLQQDKYLQQQLNSKSFPYQNPNKNYRISNPRHHLRTQYHPQQDKQYRQIHPLIDNIRLLNIEKPGYHIETPDNLLSPQEKILMQMQHEQRDEYQLFSHLPSEIQQLKLQSLKNTAEKRFEMQKQVLNQKLQKLKLLQTMKEFQLERKLLTEELQNEKKKIQIHKLMKKKIKNMVKEHFQEEKTDKDNDSQTQQPTPQQIDQDPFQPNNQNQEPPII